MKAAKVAESTDGDSEISKSIKVTLTKEVAVMAALATSLNDLIASSKEEALKAMVAGPVVLKCDVAIANLDSNKTLIELMLENGKGDVNSIMKDSKGANSEAMTCSRIMKAQLVVATSMVVLVKQ